MPRYRYQAVDQRGKKVKGQMEAEDEAGLYGALREEGEYLVKAKADRAKKGRTPLAAEVLSAFSRELGTLLEAGIPLTKAIAILTREEGIKLKVKGVYEDVLKCVCGGYSLSEAMERQGNRFPPLMIHLFKAAEASGGLGRAALRLGEHYSREHRLRLRIRSALVYPKFLAALLIAVAGLLMGVVLPQFEPLFRLVEELPLPTRILYGILDLVTEKWYLCAAAAAWAWLLGRWLKERPWFCLWAARQQLFLPITGRLKKTVYTARFARTLSALYGAGVPIARALEIAGKAVGNVYIERQFDPVAAMVQNGEGLGAAISRVDGLLPKLTFAVQVGEESGSLDAVLDSMAEALEYDAGQASERFVSYLEPAMVIVMAVVVGFVMIAVMMPIYASYQAMEGVGMARLPWLRG